MEDKNKQNPTFPDLNKPEINKEDLNKPDINISEAGEDQYDYGDTGGPGAGRDDGEYRQPSEEKDRPATMTSDVDTGAGVGSSE